MICPHCNGNGQVVVPDDKGGPARWIRCTHCHGYRELTACAGACGGDMAQPEGDVLAWPSGVPFDAERAFRMADDLDQISRDTGNCRLNDAAELIRFMLEALGYRRRLGAA